ncbi:hypothetical protein [Methylorubrum extorquens]|uniref:hypothetical protein n=1 Tax=Methylorubrum extorquens TaxID=408 RepID=UPI0020A1EBA0|nr:hypothetical protein [Methylorubrum extorquens]MCP1540085.1 hypothetical protein [Methylorubrum extorquens]
MFGPTSINGTHAPLNHLEVRCDATDRLLGWLTGIEAAKVPATEPLVFEGASDDEMVIEDEHGVSMLGIATEIRVDEFSAIFPRHNDFAGLEAIHQAVPSYAKRTHIKADDSLKCLYTWTAAVVTPEEHEELFDFDNFLPYGEENRELIEDELDFHARKIGAGGDAMIDDLMSEPGLMTGKFMTGVGTIRPAGIVRAEDLIANTISAKSLAATSTSFSAAMKAAGRALERAKDVTFPTLMPKIGP